MKKTKEQKKAQKFYYSYKSLCREHGYFINLDQYSPLDSLFIAKFDKEDEEEFEMVNLNLRHSLDKLIEEEEEEEEE